MVVKTGRIYPKFMRNGSFNSDDRNLRALGHHNISRHSLLKVHIL